MGAFYYTSSLGNRVVFPCLQNLWTQPLFGKRMGRAPDRKVYGRGQRGNEQVQIGMMNDKNIARETAKKRVQELKGYYRHIFIFVIVNGILYLLKTGVLTSLLPEAFPKESYYYDWINANVIIWALILVVHTLILFRDKFTFVKKWEQRQIQKYMDEDGGEAHK
jgi:2TM domain